ncbi:polysaccharide biosynthesis/export family protein [Falsirhodobacter deserti]|uniref:polysaccharide biosynthesis/export family protein n=1 Tax=Falsirhodobacter deserti TaxID=1365611 RepID=UPI001F4DFE9D|nr:polysaccharide biosynthesis/export family protein [Falsirhodobacter deserti]
MRALVIALSLLAPVAALAQSYGIRPGDTLRIEVAEDEAMSRDVLVLPDGTISFPTVGSVRARGMSTQQLASVIRNGIAGDYAVPPTVNVAVTAIPEPKPPREVQKQVMNIYLMGEVASPGVKEVSPGVTLLQALAQGGGFTEFAATKRVQLRRIDPASGQEKVWMLDYSQMARGGLAGGNVRLAEGDVVLVPERGLFE